MKERLEHRRCVKGKDYGRRVKERTNRASFVGSSRMRTISDL